MARFQYLHTQEHLGEGHTLSQKVHLSKNPKKTVQNE